MKNNVVWILVDGIRNYPFLGSNTTTDINLSSILDKGDMGLLPIMEQIGSDNIIFKKAICSATSTSMSISSQMTGVPSYYLSRSFDDFTFNNLGLDNLGSILKKNIYEVYGLSFAIDVRVKYDGIIDHIGEQFWPKGLNNYKAWDNDAVLHMFSKLCDHGLSSPFFLFIHLNGRYDPEISDKVESILSRLIAKGLYDDSILILNADHGMPDPHPDRRSFYYKWLIENNIPLNRHDMIMTDDNILIPLIMKYPDCPNKEIEIQVGAIDIFYTILDLLEIEYNDKIKGKYLGKTLVPLINGENVSEYKLRKFRTDARYIAQPEKLTSIRGFNYKYVYSETAIGGLDREQFYDIKNDPFEKNNLFSSESIVVQKEINKYKTIFDDMQNEAISIQEKYLSKKFRKNISKYVKGKIFQKNNKIIILALCEHTFTKMFINCCIKYFEKSRITIVTANNQSDRFQDLCGKSFDKIDCYNAVDIINDDGFININKGFYEIAFVLLENSKRSKFQPFSDFLKRLGCNVIFSNYNCEFSTSLSRQRMEYFIKKAKFNKQRYLRTPSAIFVDIIKLFSGKV